MLKYYYGYRNTFGFIFAILWVEDDGVAIGGEVETIVGNRHEITHEEFTARDTAYLKTKYPYKEPTDSF